MIAALSIAFGSNGATRIRSAAWLSAWFVLVVILAGTRALYYEHGLGAPGLGIAVALPILILCITVTRINHCATLFTGCRCGCLSACTRFVCLASVLSFFTPSTVWRRRSPRLLVDGCADRMARVSADHKYSGDCMDLEPHRNRGSDRRCRIGSYVFAWSRTLDFRRTKLRHYDNFAVALDSRLFGSATICGSHRDFRSAGECQEARTHARPDRRRISPIIMRVSTRVIDRASGRWSSDEVELLRAALAR